MILIEDKCFLTYLVGRGVLLVEVGLEVRVGVVPLEGVVAHGGAHAVQPGALVLAAGNWSGDRGGGEGVEKNWLI